LQSHGTPSQTGPASTPEANKDQQSCGGSHQRSINVLGHGSALLDDSSIPTLVRPPDRRVGHDDGRLGVRRVGAPTATQWVDEVQITVSAGGLRRVGMLNVLQFTPPSVETKASPASPIETQKFSTQESAAPTRALSDGSYRTRQRTSPDPDLPTLLHISRDMAPLGAYGPFTRR
jgi:hypothetical protein